MVGEHNPKELGSGPDKISERNQLPGRIWEIHLDGLMAQLGSWQASTN